MTDSSDISDGFHTMNDLYEHRSALLCALMRALPALSWMSPQHHDGTVYSGYFIAGIKLPTGQISYHVPMQPWWTPYSFTGAEVLEKAPVWDGHTSDDVIDRIRQWAMNNRPMI